MLEELPATATDTSFPFSAPFCWISRKDEGIEDEKEKSPSENTEAKFMFALSDMFSKLPVVDADALYEKSEVEDEKSAE